MCFGITDTPRLESAIRGVVAKYPNVTLACFERGCYEVLRAYDSCNVGFYPFMQRYTFEKFNVIGAFVGDGYDVSEFGLKEMRV